MFALAFVSLIAIVFLSLEASYLALATFSIASDPHINPYAVFSSIGASGTRSNKHMLLCIAEATCNATAGCKYWGNFMYYSLLKFKSREYSLVLLGGCQHGNPNPNDYAANIPDPVLFEKNERFQIDEDKLRQAIASMPSPEFSPLPEISSYHCKHRTNRVPAFLQSCLEDSFPAGINTTLNDHFWDNCSKVIPTLNSSSTKISIVQVFRDPRETTLTWCRDVKMKSRLQFDECIKKRHSWYIVNTAFRNRWTMQHGAHRFDLSDMKKNTRDYFRRLTNALHGFTPSEHVLDHCIIKNKLQNYEQATSEPWYIETGEEIAKLFNRTASIYISDTWMRNLYNL